GHSDPDDDQGPALKLKGIVKGGLVEQQLNFCSRKLLWRNKLIYAQLRKINGLSIIYKFRVGYPGDGAAASQLLCQQTKGNIRGLRRGDPYYQIRFIHIGIL